MAKLVVFTQTLGTGETLQRGQVIDIHADDIYPGDDVVNGVLVDGVRKNYWRIIDMPGVDPASLQHLLERYVKPEGSVDIVPLRKMKLDLDAIEAGHITKAGKLDVKDSIPVTLAEVDAVATLDPIKDGGIILPPIKG